MVFVEFISAGILFFLGGFLLFNCCYLLFFSIAGHTKSGSKQDFAVTHRKICVFMPVYQEDEVILETSKEALLHPYPGTFDVYVIADGLKSSTIKALRKQGVGVIEVKFKKSTKGKALKYAMEVLPVYIYDIAIVLDVDNIMGENFLEAVNTAFESGYKVVQAHRTAKNMDTTFAYLDACNEEVNNHIFRKGPFALGMSPSLIGSGMAFKYSYLKQLIADVGETVGEDKEIEFKILKDGEKICYLEDTYIFDEKIDSAKAFTKQRTRWVSTQFEYLKKYAADGTVQLLASGNVGLFLKIIQSYILPRTLLFGLLLVFMFLCYFTPFAPGIGFSIALIAIFTIAIILAVPSRLLLNKRILKALVYLPYALVCMCLALFRMKRTRISFMHTPHKAKVHPTPVK